MQTNEENNLPPQGVRIPRGRRGEGTVPAQSLSISGEGLYKYTLEEDNGASKEESALSTSTEELFDEDERIETHSQINYGKMSTYEDTGSSCNSKERQRHKRAASYPLDDLYTVQNNLFSQSLLVPSNVKGKRRENHFRRWIKKINAFTSGIIERAQKLQKEASMLKEENSHLRSRVIQVENDIADVKRYLSIHERNSKILIEDPEKNQSIKEGREEDLSRKVKNEEDQVSCIINRMDSFLATLIDKIQPIIQMEVRKVFTVEKSTWSGYAEKPLLAKKVLYSDMCKNLGKTECFADSVTLNGNISAESGSLVADKQISINSNSNNNNNNNRAFRRCLSDPINLDINRGSDLQLGKERNDRKSKIQNSRNKGSNNNNNNKNNDVSLICDENLENVGRKSMNRVLDEHAILIRIKDEKVVSYSFLLTELKENINLKTDIGIDTLNIRRSLSGGMILAIINQDAINKISILAEKVTELIKKYDGNVLINRLNKFASIILSGLHEFVTSEEIITAIALEGRCSKQDVHVGDLKLQSFGKWICRVTCPAFACRNIVEASRIQLGWSWASVRSVPSLLTRCFRCLKTGHIRAFCKEIVDRSTRCFRCGCSGHKAFECKETKFRCPLCMDGNEEANHRLGSPECGSPSFLPSNTSNTSVNKRNYRDFEERSCNNNNDNNNQIMSTPMRSRQEIVRERDKKYIPC